MVKEFLSAKNVLFSEYDVSINREKAREMVEKSGQMGVPVVTVDDQVVVGFNRQRLEQLLAQRKESPGQKAAPRAARPTLGLGIAEAQRYKPGASGVYVGKADPSSPAAKAGIQKGDVITEMAGRAVTDVDSVSRVMAEVRPGDIVPVSLIRDGKLLKIDVVFPR